MNNDFVVNMLLKCGAVKLDGGPYKLKSGGTSPYYVDVRVAVTQPRILRTLVALMTCDTVPPQYWAGVALGGVPLAVGCALATDTPYLMVRPEPKDHGTSKLVEGRQLAGGSDEVTLVEDVATTGGSAIKAIRALGDAGFNVTEVVAVVDREEGAAEALFKREVGFRSLATMSQILKYAGVTP
jgi:orotate phosphoribosyltransferase